MCLAKSMPWALVRISMLSHELGYVVNVVVGHGNWSCRVMMWIYILGVFICGSAWVAE